MRQKYIHFLFQRVFIIFNPSLGYLGTAHLNFMRKKVERDWSILALFIRLKENQPRINWVQEEGVLSTICWMMMMWKYLHSEVVLSYFQQLAMVAWLRS